MKPIPEATVTWFDYKIVLGKFFSEYMYINPLPSSLAQNTPHPYLGKFPWVNCIDYKIERKFFSALNPYPSPLVQNAQHPFGSSCESYSFTSIDYNLSWVCL